MKKHLLIFTLAISVIGMSLKAQAQRYVSEIFPASSVDTNVVYGSNINVLPGNQGLINLKMDVYRPAGAVDPIAQRPLVILMHTGSFIPAVFNGQPTGSKSDSTIVEMCRRFARRGYVAAAMTYRQGWNPTATGVGTAQDIRTGTLLQAVYRAIQDAKACVRYFHENAAIGGNTWGVDTNKVILGGMGTGGYIAVAYATLDQVSEINLPKFLAQNNVGSPYNYQAGFSYINQAIFGDFDGAGGVVQANYSANNHLGYSSRVQFVFNCGGALGDSTWMAAGDAPMMNFHVVGDPYAPYGDGIVVVPVTGDFVVDVSGSQVISQTANFLHNNDCYATAAASFTDPYTVRANAVNGGQEGLYPFVTNPFVQAGPWEWIDSATTRFISTNYYGKTNGYVDTMYMGALYTNPHIMDPQGVVAKQYIDTIMGYLNPRVVTCLNLTTGLHEAVQANSITIQPNPATDVVKVSVGNTANPVRSYELTDLSGRVLRIESMVNNSTFQLERDGLRAGLYLLNMRFDNGVVTQKVLFR